MKNKKDFVSFLEDPHFFVEKNSITTPRRKIIKKDQVQSRKTIEKIEWEDINEQVPEVTLIENDGKIEAIEFKCACGCGAVVQLKYEDSDGKGMLN